MTHQWQPQAVIFDMDGLLVDSEAVWQTAETAMIEARGHRYTSDVRVHVVGKRVDEFFVFLRDYYKLDSTVEELTEELTDTMLRLIPTDVSPKPGATEMIAFAQAHGWPVAIASSSPMSIIDAVVETHGWGDVFAVRCSADDEARGKPEPDVYLAAARTLGILPAQCLALEDSPNGARAAVRAGMICYAVPDATHSDMHAFEGITPYVFDSLHAVLDALR